MTDFDLQQQAIEQRRRQYAAQRDFQSPQGQMVGRHYVAPNALQYLAAGLRSYGGIKGEQIAQQELQDLGGQRKQAVADALRNFGTLSQGRPADAPLPEGVAGPVRPAQAPDMRGAYAALMEAPDASLRQVGMQGITRLPEIEAQRAQRADEIEFRRQEAEANRRARFDELQTRLQDQRASQAERLAAQKEMRDMQIQAQKEMRSMVAASRPEKQAQIIQTDQGPMQLVNGHAVPIIGPDGKPIASKPATATGVSPATRTQDARDALATIDMAEKLIGKATGSGIGSAIDTAAAVFGKSTKGAQAAAQLKAMEGDLIAKMPKMSGPQSDKDVLLYKQMAGQIGDPTIPPETKRAALQSIREIQNRYAGGAPASPSSSVDVLLEKYK